MIEFVCTPLHVRIAFRVAMVTMQFRKAQNVFIFQKQCFLIHGVPRIDLAPMKNCHGCKVGQIRFCGIGYPISVLI